MSPRNDKEGGHKETTAFEESKQADYDTQVQKKIDAQHKIHNQGEANQDLTKLDFVTKHEQDLETVPSINEKSTIAFESNRSENLNANPNENETSEANLIELPLAQHDNHNHNEGISQALGSRSDTVLILSSNNHQNLDHASTNLEVKLGIALNVVADPKSLDKQRSEELVVKPEIEIQIQSDSKLAAQSNARKHESVVEESINKQVSESVPAKLDDDGVKLRGQVPTLEKKSIQSEKFFDFENIIIIIQFQRVNHKLF